MAHYTLKVVGRREETKDTTTLVFKQPGLKKIKYLAGQYLTLQFRINGRRYIRPYSFSSAPNVDNFLEITVKRVPGGIISNHICDKVQIGDSIETLEPMGEFRVNESTLDDNHPIILWGAGSGITPLFSIAKYILGAAKSNKVILVYGNRNKESVIFEDKINHLQLQWPDRFFVWHFHTKLLVEESQPYRVQGRIDGMRVVDIMSKIDNSHEAVHYICGPLGLKESVQKTLDLLGVSSEKIFTEDFELVKNEKDLIDIITRSIKISKDDLIINLEVTRGKSILEAGLNAMIDLNYSCQTGNCSLCKGKVVKGKVKQVVNKHVDLLEDEYQLCCTYPLTDDVEVVV